MTDASGFTSATASLTESKTGKPRCVWPPFFGGHAADHVRAVARWPAR